jgi:hypothetical protein
MSTFISSSLRFLENSSLTRSYFSETTQKYAKIAAVALVIFSAITALYYIYRSYTANPLNTDDTVVPPHLSPKAPKIPTTPPKPTPPPAPSQPSTPIHAHPKNGNGSSTANNQDLDKNKKVDPKLFSSPIKPSKPAEQTDAELAQLLQAQWAAEELEEEERIEREKQKAANLFTSKPFVPSPKPQPTVTSIPIPPPAPTPAHPTAVTTQPLSPIVGSPIDKPKTATPSPFVQIENICGQIAERIFVESSFSAVKALSAVKPHTQQQVLHLLNDITAEFERRYPVSRKLKYGEQVPAYFANVAEQSQYDRQYLSLMGIRNLLQFGAQIVDDFRDTKFLGGEHNYAHKRGLQLFKWATGNMVDLDTEIEAPSDLDAIKQAEPMIIQFGKTCGLKKAGGELTAAEVARLLPYRKLDLPKSHEYVHLSMDNVDRSNYGVWKRQSPVNLKTYYYVNVPNCEIVLLATLRMPYMLAELLHHTKEYKGGILVKEFYNEYFAKGLSDKCFNDKARQFLEFYHTWNAKLEEVPTPEEDARRKIVKGVFGETLRLKGPDAALKEAFTRSKLIGLPDLANFECNHRPLDQWISEEGGKIRQILIDRKLWENVLYRAAEDKDSDFFLLNQSTFDLFLKEYHAYLQSMDF